MQTGQGTATIASGTLAVNSFNGVYPTFTVNAAQHNLGGDTELDVYINGSAGGKDNSCLLNVSGGATSIQQNADLGIDVIGALKQGTNWTIIQDAAGKDIQGDFNKPFSVSPAPPPGTNVNGGANGTEYDLSY